MLQVLDTGSRSAPENMSLDENLLLRLDANADPILHLYQWNQPSATYGYFIDPSQYLDMVQLKSHGISIARRPTGGGIVFHIWDLAFSFLMPSSHPRFSQQILENYRFVNESVLEVMKDFLQLSAPIEMIPQNVSPISPDAASFCMARPTIYDVVYQGRKIAGAAQRKRKNGYLHQGTISLALPEITLLQDLLLSEREISQAMMAYSFAPLGISDDADALRSMREEIQKRLADNLRAKL